MNDRTEGIIAFLSGFILGPLLLNISPFITVCFHWIGVFALALIIAYCIMIVCGCAIVDRRE